MQFMSIVVAALTLAPSAYTAPTPGESLAVVEKRSIISSILDIANAASANIQGPINTLTNQLAGDVTAIVVPQTETALNSITNALRGSLGGLLEAILLPVFSLTNAEVGNALSIAESTGHITYQVLSTLQALTADLPATTLTLINSELVQTYRALAPFVAPISNFVAHAAGSAGTVPSAATAQTIAIVNAINAALALASGPANVFVNQVGLSDALAALQATL